LRLHFSPHQGVIGSVLRPTDGMALHYRHLAAQIARQLNAGRSAQEVPNKSIMRLPFSW